MAIGVILNRVFRLNNNPLFDYIYSNKESINHCYFIIPTEEFEEEAKKKAQYYYGSIQKFMYELQRYDIEPFLMSYDKLIDFCKKQAIDKVVVAGDIMSYHHEIIILTPAKHIINKGNHIKYLPVFIENGVLT